MPFLLPVLLLVALPLDPPAPANGAAPPAITTPAVAPVIDPKAEALLAANAKAMFALKSYGARCDTVYTYPPDQTRPQEMRRYQMSTLTAIKPNLMRYDGWEMKKVGDAAPVKARNVPTYIFVSDGKRGVQQFGATYRANARLTPSDMGTILEPWEGFYSPTWNQQVRFAQMKKGRTLQVLRLDSAATVNGVRCDVIAYKFHADYGDGQDYDGKLYLGPDHLVRRQVETVQLGTAVPFTRDATLSNIRTNFAPPSAATFVYTPPAGVKSEAEAAAARPKLLANGVAAPDFTVEDLDGKPVKLSDFRGKTVILDFWATWCLPCMNAMPHTNAAGQKFKDKDVVVVAVNVWDTKDAYKAWVPKNQSKYEAVTFLLDPKGNTGDVASTLYKVSGIPTQYVIDAQGIVRASFVGNSGDPKPLEAALTQAMPGGK